jgi:ABC-type multidrug transport system ATPase subunit
VLHLVAQAATGPRVEDQRDRRARSLSLQALEHDRDDSFCVRMTAPRHTAPFAPALRITGLRHSFPVALGLRRREVLRGIDLELPAGASLGLVGPNGSGKSTLLRLIAGVDRARAGELLVLGDTPDSGAVRRRIGYLPEDSPFPPELRALPALVLLGTLRKMSRAAARERGAELLRRVGLADAQRVPLGRYSRGMLRRFGLAQAVLHEPDLLLLDEPTAGLDATGFAVLDELLGEARERGAATVFASHLASDLDEHCERVAVMMDGRVALQGTPGDLFADGGLSALYRRLGRTSP